MLGKGICNIGGCREDLTKFELKTKRRGDELCAPVFGMFIILFKL